MVTWQMDDRGPADGSPHSVSSALRHLPCCKQTYFWLCWVFVAARAFLYLWLAGYSAVAVHRLFIAMASLIAEHGL